MEYIVVNIDEMTVDVSDELPRIGYVLSTEMDRLEILRDPIGQLLYHRVLHPSVRARHRRGGVRKVAYCGIEPDPWLVATAALMWQGIVQGLTWDVVKLFLSRAISVMRKNGLAPSDRQHSNTAIRRMQLEFSWTMYARTGKKRAELFLQIQREYETMPQHERDRITKSMNAPSKKSGK